MVKLSKVSKIYNSLYTDRLTVQRFVAADESNESSYNEDGTLKVGEELVTIYEDKKCRISFSSKDNETPELDVNKIEQQIKLFCDVTLEIKKGDYLKIDRMSDDGCVLATYEAIASLPFKYVSHQEIYLTKTGYA